MTSLKANYCNASKNQKPGNKILQSEKEEAGIPNKNDGPTRNKKVHPFTFGRGWVRRILIHSGEVLIVMVQNQQLKVLIILVQASVRV